MFYIVRWLVWAGGKVYIPEQFVDSDVRTRQLLCLSRALSMVTPALVSGALQKGRGRVSLCSVVEGNGPV